VATNQLGSEINTVLKGSANDKCKQNGREAAAAVSKSFSGKKKLPKIYHLKAPLPFCLHLSFADPFKTVLISLPS
jgi:hypothetical protein